MAEVPEGRRRMVAEVAAEMRHLIGSFDPAVEAALLAVPREALVPAALQASAFDNRPLPIGHGQTISQPFIVALMTQLAAARPEERGLEIGAGSGYQAAVLARLIGRLWTVESVPALVEGARAALARLEARNVTVLAGDGFAGHPPEAPYDVIVVTAAPERVPPALVDQLAPGGRLVIPTGPVSGHQMLHRILRQPDGTIEEQPILPVRFVPMLPVAVPPLPS